MEHVGELSAFMLRAVPGAYQVPVLHSAVHERGGCMGEGDSAVHETCDVSPRTAALCTRAIT